jgi:Zn-dependent protease
MITILSIIILVFSIIVHEVAHGFMADWLGDPTARLQGRLTLNPIKHIDPVGSIIVPLITSLSGFTFGWAKPVQWNPYNVKDKRMGELLISIAGPASNILIALVFGLIIRLAGNSLSASFISISVYIVIINIVLAVFNLVPLPPLDGSKILFSILPSKYMWIREMLEAYSVFFFLLLIFFVWRFIEPVIPLLFKVIVG